MTIEELRDKIDHWRKNKKSPREKIPEGLWQEAVILAQKSSHSTVAKKTGLSPSDLKKRLGLSSPRRSLPTPKFNKIEMPLAAQPIFELTTAQGNIIRVFQ